MGKLTERYIHFIEGPVCDFLDNAGYLLLEGFLFIFGGIIDRYIRFIEGPVDKVATKTVDFFMEGLAFFLNHAIEIILILVGVSVLCCLI